MVVLAPLVALGFAVRFAGLTWAVAHRRWSMPWGYRATSWGLIGVAAVLLGLAGSLFTVAAFGAFVVLDALAGLVKRDPTPAAPGPVRAKRRWWIPLAVAAYLAGAAAFHLLVGAYLPFGVLLTWSLLALGFSATLLLALNGPKAGERWLHAPADHKAHERREEPVADPQRERAQEVLLAFRARGDAGPFLALVREAAAAADLAEEDVRRLEERILASFARAGTDREQDVRAALDEVENLLSLRSRPLDVTP